MVKRRHPQHKHRHPSKTDRFHKNKGTYPQRSGLSIVNGSFYLHPNGFGFVKADTPHTPDIFIPPHATFGALTLDYVQIQVEFSGKGRSSGRIIKILKHRSDLIVGTVFLEKKQWFLAERKSKKLFSLRLPKKVGLANADHVIATLDPDRRTQSAFYKRHIDPSSFPDCRDALIAEFGLSQTFPAQVDAEMHGIRHGDKDALGLPSKNRVNLSRKAFVTIDGPDAKDFDDAVYSERITSGGYRLWVSIADVSAFVAQGSACDEEAYNRGTSTYFPGFALPMLPHVLSSDLCSLLPQQMRWTFTMEIRLDEAAEPVERSLYPSVISSKARLTYGEVQAFLDGNESPPITAPIAESLQILEEIAKKLAHRRHHRGSLDFDLPEAVFVLDDEKTVKDVKVSTRLFSHRLIEELMILANEQVAEFMEEHALPGLWRIHASPDPLALEHFLTCLKTYSHVVIDHAAASPKHAGKKEKKPSGAMSIVSPKQLQGWVKDLKGKHYEPFMMKLLLRSLKQACYEEENIGHFGLASESYTHFTSPIRRYPDLFIHRLLRRFLMAPQKKSPPPPMPIGAFSSHRERISMEAEREMNKLYSAQFMRDKVGKVFSGKVSHATPNGLFVLLDDYFVEGFVPALALGPNAHYDELHLAWIAAGAKTRYELGHAMTVQVLAVDLYERSTQFGLV